MGPYRFGRFSDEESPHAVGMPAEDVFEDNIEENSSAFLPLLAVDLSEINDDWDGTAHLMYGGMNEGGVSFSMKIVDGATTLAYDGSYEFDEEGMAERDIRHGYMAFEEVDIADSLKPENWVQDAERWHVALKEVNDQLQIQCHIGGKPLWTQSDETPECTGCGNSMQFIAQANASLFSDEVGDVDYFLFYCHGCKVQTLIDQMT